MAGMTQSQITAELKRKASLGLTPTNTANQAQYNQIKSSTNTSNTPTTSNTAKNPPVLNNPLTGGLPSSASGGEDFSGNRSNIEANIPTTPNTPITGTYSGPSVISSDGGSINLNSPTPAVDPAKELMEQIKKAQLASRISGLDKARNDAKLSLENEKAGIAPTYYNKRNQAAANSDVGAMNFAQYMASRGIKGNAGAMPEIYRNNALQGQIGALDQAEAQDMARIARDSANIDNNYASDIANANADVESQALQSYLTQMNADRAYNLQANSQKFNQNMATNQYNSNQLDRQKEEYANNVDRFYSDYQSEINKVKSDGDPTNDWQLAYLEAARLKKLSGISDIQTEQLKTKEQQLDNEAKAISNKYASQIAQGQLDQLALENEYKKLVNAGYNKQQAADLAYKNALTNNVGASEALGYARLDWDKDPTNPDNINKLGKGTLQYKDYVSMGRDMLDKGYQTTDNNVGSPTYGQTTYSKINTPQQVKAWVDGLPLTPEEQAKLANDLGLPKP